ncbi:MAG: hypothetical protein AAF596_10580 [Planctomycetota bacterium]
MQINIPDDAVPQIAARAKEAGYGDVEAYVLNLVMPAGPVVVDREGVEAAIDAGFASGVSSTPVKAFLGELRQKLQA